MAEQVPGSSPLPECRRTVVVPGGASVVTTAAPSASAR